MPTVFAVGVTGRLGRKVVDSLRRGGVQVRALVRPGNSEGLRASGHDPAIEVFVGDIHDPVDRLAHVRVLPAGHELTPSTANARAVLENERSSPRRPGQGAPAPGSRRRRPLRHACRGWHRSGERWSPPTVVDLEIPMWRTYG